MWLDKLLVMIGMGGLIAFCTVVMYFVAEPDLIVVTLICLGIAIYDFWVSVFRANSDG